MTEDLDEADSEAESPAEEPSTTIFQPLPRPAFSLPARTPTPPAARASLYADSDAEEDPDTTPTRTTYQIQSSSLPSKRYPGQLSLRQNHPSPSQSDLADRKLKKTKKRRVVDGRRDRERTTRALPGRVLDFSFNTTNDEGVLGGF